MILTYSESITALLYPKKGINPYIFSFFHVSDTEYNMVKEWLEESFGRKGYKLTSNSVSFKEKEHAAYFKLVWLDGNTTN